MIFCTQPGFFQCACRPCDVVRPIVQALVFNFPGEKQRRFCYDHKLPGMVNLRRANKRPRSEAAAAPPTQVCSKLQGLGFRFGYGQPAPRRQAPAQRGRGCDCAAHAGVLEFSGLRV